MLCRGVKRFPKDAQPALVAAPRGKLPNPPSIKSRATSRRLACGLSNIKPTNPSSDNGDDTKSGDDGFVLGEKNTAESAHNVPASQCKNGDGLCHHNTSEDNGLVEEFVDNGRRKTYGDCRWLVKWKGYDESHNTWEPEDQLEADLGKEFFNDCKKRCVFRIALG